MTNDELIIKTVHELIPCDSVRLSKPLEKTFVIIGYKRNTKEDEGTITMNGKEVDYDYLREIVIASGITTEEVIEDVKRYNELAQLLKHINY